MRNLSKFALAGIIAAGLAGTAMAASNAVHVMTVPLPDGAVARIQYAGDVAPRVTIAPAGPQVGVPAALGLPGFQDPFLEMDRQMAAMMRQMDALSRAPMAAGPAGANFAAYGGALPAGTTSYSSVTVNQNGHQCSRTTEVIGQGAGRPPRVSSKVRGDCGTARPGEVPHGAPAAVIPDGPIHQS